MDRYIGKLLDNRYEILECIGTGGMAVVYKARCHRLNRLVAVKILKPELAQDAEFRRRFHDESQAVAMLSHPNIVAVYDVSSSDDLDYIVMELIDGITLKQYMHKKGLPLNWREALHFITQIMKALSHAHDRGIIHRDIKPQNIMVLRDGSVKVADFGIARLASAAQATLTQEALGSVHYISPEQARGSYIDTRADIYSAGVVLYEMTAGRLPYEGDTPVSVAIQHINSIPLPTRDINPDIPEALEGITMKAMASDVDKRYVSADAMLVDLEEFRKNPGINFEYTKEELFQAGAADTAGAAALVDEPTIVRGSTSETKAEKKSSRRRQRDYDDEYDEDDYDDRRGRGGVVPVILAVIAILIFIAGIVYFLWSTIFGGIITDHSEEVKVPNLIGMTIEEVNRDLALGNIDSVFKIEEGRMLVSDMPAGQIIDQDPSPNDTKKGDDIVITVDISSGPEIVKMPELENTEFRQAVSILQDELGLKVDPIYENSDEITRNYIIRTEPVADIILEPGQVVRLVISKGPEVKKVPVPNFLNWKIDDVMMQLETLGLKAEIVETQDEETEKGTVLYQSVIADTDVEAGTTIIFHISSGPLNNDNPTGDTPGADDPLDPTDPTVPNDPDPSTSTEPVVPSDPVVDPSVKPTDPPVIPSPPVVEQPAIATTKTVQVDLSGYTEVVQVRIEVGGNVQHNSPVDPMTMSTFSKPITGTGVQSVVIYVNDEVVKNMTVNFDQ